ncbi:hypothetical protein PUN28_019066 [Cardiocondyla obscurior]|uniref:Uncharacterized protein n=1 Tax=Cardiocondyla obscurior TaxID=286306 RepID=A0AAW2EE45_9HYME
MAPGCFHCCPPGNRRKRPSYLIYRAPPSNNCVSRAVWDYRVLRCCICIRAQN